VRPSRRATSLLVSPVGSLAKSSSMSRPFSKAGVGYRRANLVFPLRIFRFHIPSVQRPLKPENQISKSSACSDIDRVYRKRFPEEKSRHFQPSRDGSGSWFLARSSSHPPAVDLRLANPKHFYVMFTRVASATSLAARKPSKKTPNSSSSADIRIAQS
jgi:hypothetical protein